MYILISLLLLLIILKDDFKIISSKYAKEMIRNNLFNSILDVRSNEEWNNGNYPGSINIPYKKLNKKNIKNLKEPLLVYCRSGRRAKIAAKKLLDFGLKKVYVITSNYKSLL